MTVDFSGIWWYNVYILKRYGGDCMDSLKPVLERIAEALEAIAEALQQLDR